MIIYACERLLRAFRSGYKSVKILKVHKLWSFFFVKFKFPY
jgi:hypothetical protein